MAKEWNRRSKALEALLDMPLDWHKPSEVAKKAGMRSAAQSLSNLHGRGILDKQKRGDYRMAPVYYRLAQSKKKTLEGYREWQAEGEELRKALEGKAMEDGEGR